MEMILFKFLLFVSYLYGCHYIGVSSTAPFMDCTAIGYIGMKYPKDIGNQPLGADRGKNYLLVDPDKTFPCCGVIEEWDAYIEQAGTIVFEIWRPSSGNKFQRVGSNNVTVAGKGEIPLTVQTGARHTVYPGDCIGWYTETHDMVAYKLGNGGEATTVKYFMQSQTPSESDMILDWTSAKTENKYTYAIRARYGVNGAPRFLNLDADIKVTPPIDIGYAIYTVNATDDDISDITITQLIYNCITKSSYFSFNNTNKKVTVIANLSSKVGYECLTFTVQDICQNTDTGQLCITIHNDPPSVNCNPQTASVVESTSGNINITTLNVNDTNGDTVTCSIFGTSPTGSQFRLQQNSGVYMIYTNANPNFRVAANDQYGIHITCTDGKTSTSVICGVKILPSPRPNITNLPNSVTLNTSNIKSYDFFNVNVSDPDSTNFIYSLTCVPTKCPFAITSSGVIQLTENLENHSIERYNVFITATDGYSQVTDTLTVTISGINYAPVLRNLPQASKLMVPENTAISTSTFQVMAFDINNDSLNFNLVLSPANVAYFSIDNSSGIISTSADLDFETMTSKTFTLTVSVTDGKLSASSTLVVQVLDVNERPSFEQSAYIIQTNESVAGSRLPDPRFNVRESDAGDYVKFSQDCGAYTGYLRMDANSGQLNFAVDYDLDGAGLPALINCTVNATDKSGLIATAYLSIIINEINDHRPIFTYPSYTFYAYIDSTAGLLLGNISATDADNGTNGMFYFSTNQNGLSKLYFDVSPTGQVILLSNLNEVLAGTKLQFTVLATDIGSPPLIGSTFITVIILEGSTTTAPMTTTKYKTFFRDEGNIAWFSLAMITGLAVMAITAFICARYICNWPSNFDPLNTCTTNFRKLEFCKDSRIYHNTEHKPKVSSRGKITKPRSPPRKRLPSAASVQMRSSPTPPRRSMMVTPHANSAQTRELTTGASSVQMWFSPTPPIRSILITPQAANAQMRVMITEPRLKPGDSNVNKYDL
ncbi:hypothetical protein CHS0354_003759 [Potamilus streckersoni]|uniref:Cadherin domain-containing protein n=1 Tax=Potamilus streckersoni TaxID=2493646 RepID=A0AAE0VVJ6_9BIVA|nr:hypothetical protein CHS0354_003759 [Potamilus streckersoni]